MEIRGVKQAMLGWPDLFRVGPLNNQPKPMVLAHIGPSPACVGPFNGPIWAHTKLNFYIEFFAIFFFTISFKSF